MLTNNMLAIRLNVDIKKYLISCSSCRITVRLHDLYFYFKAHHLIQFILLPGRLYQVEYAMEAVGHAGICLGILANDGIVLAAERRNTNKLLDEVFASEKIYKLHE